MLKIRVIPTLLYKDFGLVKGVRSTRAVVGSPMQAIKVYNLRNVDELVFLDVTAQRRRARPRPRARSTSSPTSASCRSPSAAGSVPIDDVGAARVGADKVVIGTAAVDDPELVARGRRPVRLAVRGGGDRHEGRG